ncbi:hypothetical protein K0817_004520 [Microbacterium sp. HD4P20]|uniref:hypothetical protein n=1 Tax=Microbacterium sp. HD4P20 TaxID=2864874 RepID=UPI001C64299E|nr:hypothetical protein [Microbacterium sp. HD4P20]MCP2635831.1 hypothetical protein [Microbacterium sp. HD4P20]
MIAIVQVAGRLLWRHWPVLLAWYLGAILARYALIEVAGYVGAYSAVAGSLLLPLAILARLIALVAMFLVLRDGMRQLNAIAPLTTDPAERRREFFDALMTGILPFFAFYAAWGYLREDADAYIARVLEVDSEMDAVATFEESARAGDGAVGELGLTPITIAIAVAAFVLRWLWKRYRGRLPKWSGVPATYLEAVWVYYAVTVVSMALGALNTWVSSRQAMVWLADLREVVTVGFAPLAWVWEGVEWLLGEAGGIILLPVAWLTIAGVVYGQAVAPQAVPTDELGGEIGERLRARYRSLPQRLRARLRDIWSDVVGRFTPIGRAFVLMWRSGPVLIGGFVLLYTLLLAAQGVLGWGVTRLVGPHDLSSFWLVWDQLILLIVPVLIEPVRIALVAGGYDAVIGRLIVRQGATTSLANSGSNPPDSMSTTNGPDASSGTR